MAKSWNEPLSQEDMKKAQERKGQRFTDYRKPYIDPDIPVYVPRVGANVVRIIQPFELNLIRHWALWVHYHRSVGPYNDMYLCNYRMVKDFTKMKEILDALEIIFDPRCAECEKRTSELWDTDPDLAKTYYPDDRYLCWVLDLEERSENPEQALLWSTPKSLVDEIAALSHKPDTDVYQDPSDPENGCKVFFNRTGEKRDTKYSGVSIGTTPYPLKASILDDIRYFVEVLIIPTYDEVKEASDAVPAALPEGTAPSGDFLDAMGEEELLSYIEREGLGIVPRKTWSEDDIRNEIRANIARPDQPASEGAAADPTSDSVLPDDIVDCYGKQFDQWQECADCGWRQKCEKNEPVGAKPAKAKPAKPTKEKPAKDQPAANAGAGSTKAEVKSRLEQAIERRKGKS